MAPVYTFHRKESFRQMLQPVFRPQEIQKLVPVTYLVIVFQCRLFLEVEYVEGLISQLLEIGRDHILP